MINALAAVALSVGSTGCVGSPEDVTRGTDEVLTYDAGTSAYSNLVRRSIRYSANPVKVFEIGRIEPGSTVQAFLTRDPSEPPTGLIKFELQFSTNGTTWTTPSATLDCGAWIAAADNAEKQCQQTSAASDVYARIAVSADVGANAQFVLRDNHLGPKNDVHHSHYGSETFTIPAGGWSPNGSGPDRQWLYIGLKSVGTESNPTRRRLLPGALQFQRIVLSITRSGAAIGLDHLDGPRLMERTELTTDAVSGPAVEIADFGCPQDANGQYIWINNNIECVLDVVPRDGFVHVPLSRTNGNTTATASVTLTRTSPRAAGTGSVRSQLTASITNNYRNTTP